MNQLKLFDIPEKKTEEIKNTCRGCKHRQRWQCEGSIIQYCGVRKSNRTVNKLLKIKCKNKACLLFEKLKS